MGMVSGMAFFSFFFFNDTATTEIYTLSLHDALPISSLGGVVQVHLDAHGHDVVQVSLPRNAGQDGFDYVARRARSEEHTSELQSRQYLVCRLLLEKKKGVGGVAHVQPARPTVARDSA